MAEAQRRQREKQDATEAMKLQRKLEAEAKAKAKQEAKELEKLRRKYGDQSGMLPSGGSGQGRPPHQGGGYHTGSYLNPATTTTTTTTTMGSGAGRGAHPGSVSTTSFFGLGSSSSGGGAGRGSGQVPSSSNGGRHHFLGLPLTPGKNISRKKSSMF